MASDNWQAKTAGCADSEWTLKIAAIQSKRLIVVDRVAQTRSDVWKSYGVSAWPAKEGLETPKIVEGFALSSV